MDLLTALSGFCLQTHNSWLNDTASTSNLESTGASTAGVENEHPTRWPVRFGSSSTPAATTTTLSNPGSRLAVPTCYISKTTLTANIPHWSTFAPWTWSHTTVCTLTAPLSLAAKWTSTTATTAGWWEPRYQATFPWSWRFPV